MKNSLIALCTALLLSSCVGTSVTKITKTDVATGATNPKAIYIRPFDITYGDYIGQHRGGIGERPIRRSLAPAELAMAFRNELCKIAPAMVLKDNEVAHTGWLVTGDIVLVDAGIPSERMAGFTFGQSKVKVHVRIIDLDSVKTRSDSKDADESKELANGRGNIIYEFDVMSSSHLSGELGEVNAPGGGYSVPFDFKNIAERVLVALTPDLYHYGEHSSIMIER